MGMLAHAIAVMVVPQRGNPMTLEYYLPNEEWLMLSRKAELFQGKVDGPEAARRIPQGFRHPDDEVTDVRAWIAVDDYGKYSRFEEQLQALAGKKLKCVVLMSWEETPYDPSRYRFSWVRYGMNPDEVTEGVDYGNSRADGEKLLLSLKEPGKGKPLTAAQPVQELFLSQEERDALNEQTAREWMERYGHAVDKGVTVEFENKIFVLAGIMLYTVETKVDLEAMIRERGGIIRKEVSGKTDYLIAYPKWAMESRIKAVLAQRAKGKTIRVILADDLAKQLTCPEEPAVEPAEPVDFDALGFDVKNGNLSAVRCEGDEVVIPEGVVTMDSDAFSGKPGLRSLRFPSTMEDLGGCAFQECPELEKVVIEPGMTELCENAFDGAQGLKTVELPNTIRKICSGAFWDCTALEEIWLPEGLEVLEENAFYKCTALKKVHFPRTLRTVGSGAFRGCTALEEAVFYDGLTELGDCAFHSCAALNLVHLPETLRKIGNAAFVKCPALSQMMIPASVAEFGWVLVEEGAACLILVPEGSYAARWCEEKGVRHISL